MIYVYIYSLSAIPYSLLGHCLSLYPPFGQAMVGLDISKMMKAEDRQTFLKRLAAAGISKVTLHRTSLVRCAIGNSKGNIPKSYMNILFYLFSCRGLQIFIPFAHLGCIRSGDEIRNAIIIWCFRYAFRC